MSVVLQLVVADGLWPTLAVLLVFVWLVTVALVRPHVIVGAAIALYGYESVFGLSRTFNVGGIVLYPRDALYIAMAVAGCIHVATTPPTYRPLFWAWKALIAIVTLSFFAGLRIYGTNAAGNDFRGMFYLLAAVVFLVTVRDRRRCIATTADVWIAVGLLLALVGFGRMAGLNIGAAAVQKALAGGRPLYSGPALMVGQAALIALFAERFGSRWATTRWLPYPLLFGVLVFRHRSVWLAMLVAFALVFTVLRQGEGRLNQGRVARRIAAILVAGSAVILLAVSGGTSDSFRSGLVQSTETAAGRGSTSAWRIEGWEGLLREQARNPSHLVFGVPFGAGYVRKVEGRTVTVSPHSWYVQTLARSGVPGLLCLILCLGRAFKDGRTSELLPGGLGAVLVASTMVYGVAYGPPEVQGLLIGLVILAGSTKIDVCRAKGDPERRSAVRRGAMRVPV